MSAPDCRCPSNAHTCGAPNDGEEHYVKWAAETEAQLDRASAALANPNETIDEVAAAIELAQLAYRIALNEAREDEWPEKYEPECICPPELLARGGLQGRVSRSWLRAAALTHHASRAAVRGAVSPATAHAPSTPHRH